LKYFTTGGDIRRQCFYAAVFFCQRVLYLDDRILQNSFLDMAILYTIL